MTCLIIGGEDDKKPGHELPQHVPIALFQFSFCQSDPPSAFHSGAQIS